MAMQVIREFKRPRIERRLRRARQACDIFALLTVLWMTLLPWLMDYSLEVGRTHGIDTTARRIQTFEYHHADQKWHWVAPKE